MPAPVGAVVTIAPYVLVVPQISQIRCTLWYHLGQEARVSVVVDILIALLISVIIYALASLIVRKLPIPAEFVWIVWLVAIILIVIVWWARVLAPLIGPLP